MRGLAATAVGIVAITRTAAAASFIVEDVHGITLLSLILTAGRSKGRSKKKSFKNAEILRLFSGHYVIGFDAPTTITRRSIVMNRSTRFAKWVFLIAGIYGLIVGIPLLFLEEKMGIDYPPPTNHPEQYYGFLLVIIAWAVMFLFLSRDPLKYRLLMIPAILEKIPYAITVFILTSQGRIAEMNVPFGLIDLTFGILFTVAYVTTRETQNTAA